MLSLVVVRVRCRIRWIETVIGLVNKRGNNDVNNDTAGEVDMVRVRSAFGLIKERI